MYKHRTHFSSYLFQIGYNTADCLFLESPIFTTFRIFNSWWLLDFFRQFTFYVILLLIMLPLYICQRMKIHYTMGIIGVFNLLLPQLSLDCLLPRVLLECSRGYFRDLISSAWN